VQPKRKSWDEIQTLGRFLLFILCGGNAERRRFSRRILWATLRAKPDRLPDAIYLVVVHKHFYEFVGQCAMSIEKELEQCVDVEFLETQAGAIA
jgi:RNase P protein component